VSPSSRMLAARQLAYRAASLERLATLTERAEPEPEGGYD
jgi:hypothetical protein